MAANDGIKGFIIGGVIGTILGILCAPKSGKDLRKEIRHSSEELLKKSQRAVRTDLPKDRTTGKPEEGAVHREKGEGEESDRCRRRGLQADVMVARFLPVSDPIRHCRWLPGANKRRIVPFRLRTESPKHFSVRNIAPSDVTARSQGLLSPDNITVRINRISLPGTVA